jgi:uncharacterized protein (DUF697 family)
MSENNSATTEATVSTTSPTENSRAETAHLLVRSHLPWSAGAGIIPLPGLDLTALLAVQVRMLAKLAELYEIPFREQAAKSLIASLLGVALPASFAGGIASSVKAIPLVGTLFGIATLPALGAAATYAIGKVFITHFESGGTFLDFDPAAVEAHFRDEFAKAKAAGGTEKTGRP